MATVPRCNTIILEIMTRSRPRWPHGGPPHPPGPRSVWPLAESLHHGRAGWNRSRGRSRRRGGLGRDPLGRLAEGAVDLELGDVVLADGKGILLIGGVQRDDRGDDFLGADDQAEQLAGGPRRLAQADEVFVGRLDRLEDALLSLHYADPRGLQPGDGLRDLRLDPEDGPCQLDRGDRLLGPPLPDPADVADP